VDAKRVRLALVSMSWTAATRSRYEAWLDKFASWHGSKPDVLVEPDEDEVADFLVELYLGGKGGQAGMARAALGAYWPQLSKSEPLSRLVAGIDAQWRLQGGGRVQRDALPKKALQQFIAAQPLSLSRFEWLRDRFLALLSVRTMRRPAELLQLYREDVRWDAQEDNLLVRFVKSKNDRLGKHGKRFWLPIDRSDTAGLCVSEVANAYFRARGSAPGPLWQRLDGSAVTKDHLNALAKFIGARSGVEGLFRGYSFRIAGATYAAEAGMTTAEIQAIGGWRSEAVHTYIRATGSAAGGASARMGL